MQIKFKDFLRFLLIILCSELFIEDIQNLSLKNLVIASPDMGGSKRANVYAKFLNCGVVICYKQEQRLMRLVEMFILGDISGKDVVLIDDMVDTAGTLTKAADLMIKMEQKVFEHILLMEYYQKMHMII